VVESGTRTLVVCNAAGTPIDVVLENEKGYKKSIESGRLWALHGDTGRLLPYGAELPATIEDCGTWYRAVLGSDTDDSAYPPGTSVPQAAIPGTGSTSEPGRAPSAAGTAPEAPGEAQAAGGAESDQGLSGVELGEVLTSLAAVIRDRHRKLPEGSYTTHLFTAGSEKIRKKAGEEAVELILASNRADLTSEAADLIYHLLVLLEAEGIPLSDIARELRRR